MGSTRKNSPPISVLILLMMALVLFWDQKQLQRQEELPDKVEENPALAILQSRSNQEDGARAPAVINNDSIPVSFVTDESKTNVKPPEKPHHSVAALNHKRHKSKWSFLGTQG